MSSEPGHELNQLCRACGACCSGAMFGYVSLEAGEVSIPARRKLKVFTEAETGDERFSLPCTALESAGCGVYEDRPKACREYACGLYRDHEQHPSDLETKLAKVRRIRELLDKIGARANASKGAWLPAPIAEIAAWDASRMSALLQSVGAEALLDIAELGMRLRRDLRHVPKKSG